MIARLVLCVCAVVCLSGAALALPAAPAASEHNAAPADHAVASPQNATPFECKTELGVLANALRAYTPLADDPNADADDDDDGDEAKVAYAPEGLRVFGFEPDELDLTVSPDGIDLSTFVHASYDDVIRATSTHAAAAAARFNMPVLNIDAADEHGEEIAITCHYERGQSI